MIKLFTDRTHALPFFFSLFISLSVNGQRVYQNSNCTEKEIYEKIILS